MRAASEKALCGMRSSCEMIQPMSATGLVQRIGQAMAGLLAGGIGAVFYAAHCPDDSLLFAARRYTIAIGVMTGLGALGGRQFLRW